jgi:histidinol-phosphate aminotransferase
LRAALSEYAGVPAQNILPGHGADELIDLLTRLMVGPGDAIIDCPPTFGMYSFDAGLAGARVVRSGGTSSTGWTWRRSNRLLAKGDPAPKLLFLTSPNNPDGGFLDRRLTCDGCSHCRCSSWSTRRISSSPGWSVP